MQKGDLVMADHPDSRSRTFIRSYGIVQEITKIGDVIIEMADGSLIKRKYQSIAVYIQPPSNWQELLNQQQIVYAQPKKQIMSRGSIQSKGTSNTETASPGINVDATDISEL